MWPCCSPTGMNTPPTANQAPPGARNPNQQQQPPNQSQHVHFEGAISELHGHIYDLVAIHSTHLFTTSTQAIATYMGHKLGGDICCSIETFMLASVTHPTRAIPPPPTADGTIVPIDLLKMDIYMEEVKEYVKQC